MIKQEWKNIIHNRWIKVVLIAIIFIPTIYACVFLGSMWDPYGNSGDLPVAVVNEDQEVQYNDETLNVGQELVDNLKDNHSLDFHFVNAKEAQQGLQDGSYYMIITIPSDFSKSATTLLDDEPQKMILKYTTNPGTNYIASKMDDTAIMKIKDEVSSTITKTYAETIFHSIDTLSNGLSDAHDGTSELLDGINQLSQGNQKISQNLKTLASSSLVFKDGATTLEKGLKDYTDGVLTVHNGVYSLKQGLNVLNNSTIPLSQGIDQLKDGATSLNTGLTQYTQGVSQVYQGTNQLSNQNTALNKGIDDLLHGVQEIEKAMTSTSSSSNEALAQAIQSSQQQNKESLIVIEELKGQITDEQYQTLLASINQSNAINNGFTSIPKEIQNNQTTAVNELSQIDQGLQSLQMNVKAYTQGVEDVNNGLNVLTQKQSELLRGSSALSQGLSSVQQSTPSLINGIKALNDGANQLYAGTNKLTSNHTALLNGVSSLNNGANLISQGSSQLAQGSQTLGQGLTDAQKGTNILNDALKDGAEESKVNSSEATTDMMSSPVQIDHQEISTVENNGHAMAPYMMSVALYVAALAFTLMYPVRRGIKEAKNGVKYWISKATVMYSISTLSAIVMITALRYINGFEPQQLAMTYLFAIIVAAAFMSMVMLLSLTTGYIGEFLLLVFMIFNLGGSAGTYPLQTSSAFFKAIHSFVPYTYSVDGFRKVISMASATLTTELCVFIGIFVICTLLTILYYQYKNKEDRHIIPQAFEKVNE